MPSRYKWHNKMFAPKQGPGQKVSRHQMFALKQGAGAKIFSIPTKNNLFLQAKWGDHAVCVVDDRKVNEKDNLLFNQLTHVLALAAGTPTSTSMPVRRT